MFDETYNRSGICDMVLYPEGIIVTYNMSVLNGHSHSKVMKTYENVECFDTNFNRKWRVNGFETSGHFDLKTDFFVGSNSHDGHRYLISYAGYRYIVDMATGKIKYESFVK